MDAENKWTDSGQLGRELERVKTECVDSFRRQNERLREALEAIADEPRSGLNIHGVTSRLINIASKALSAQTEKAK